MSYNQTAKKMNLWLLALTFLMLTTLPAFAGPHRGGQQNRPRNPQARVNTKWEHRADKNHNGVVNPQEMRRFNKNHPNHPQHPQHPNHPQHPQHPQQSNHDSHSNNQDMKQKSQVNTRWENRADKNNDGHVDQTEANSWQNKDHNKNNQPNRVVNSKWENRADRNNDGIVDDVEKAKFDQLKGGHSSDSVETTVTE
jgi:hypothetical protein